MNLYLQRACDFYQCSNRRIPGCALHVGNIGALECGPVSELLLRPPAFGSQGLDTAPEITKHGRF
jgi:hypothetical protein